MKRYICFILALMVLAAAIGAACDSAEPSAYEALLGTIPDTPRTRWAVSIYDYALVRQMFDIPLPGPEDGEDALEEYYAYDPPFEGLGDVFPALGGIGLSFFDPFSRDSNQIHQNFQHLAFDVRNIDRIVLAYAELPPEHEGTTLSQMEVIQGRFDPQASDAALSTCSECPAPSREEHRGIPFYSWGEDYALDRDMQFKPPAFDEFGRGGRIAVMDEYLFRSLGTSEMQTLIDTHLNEEPSLAEVEEFRLLANAMSQLGAYFMILSDDAEVWDISEIVITLVEGHHHVDIDRVRQEIAELGPWLRPYDAYATGAGKDEDGSYIALALVHADDASAEENVGLLHRRIEEGSSFFWRIPWSDVIDVGRLEIKAEGLLLLAKLRGFARSWSDWLLSLDPLIGYE